MTAWQDCRNGKGKKARSGLGDVSEHVGAHAREPSQQRGGLDRVSARPERADRTDSGSGSHPASAPTSSDDPAEHTSAPSSPRSIASA